MVSERTYRWFCALVALSVGACFPSHATPLPSCATNGVGLHDGRLRILPSEIPGVWIDSASWTVRTESPEMATETHLAYEAHLRSDHPAPLDSLAIAFHSTRPADDSLLLVGGWRVSQPTRYGGVMRFGRDSLRPDEPRTAMKVLRVPGSSPGSWACPEAVQVVRVRRGPGW
jgi:hypothetical protein